MIDMFSLVVTHGLMALVAWRLLSRKDLDPAGETPEVRDPNIAAAAAETVRTQGWRDKHA